MRLILHLLALVALLVAPLAAPAAAIAPSPTAADCTDTAMEMADHDMPDSHHGENEACCIAVPPAIDPPLTTLAAFAAIDHLLFVAVKAPFRLGAGPNAEDPPPRIA